MDKSKIGKAGEDYCCKYFQKSGYEIIARNYHSRYGEIDVIAQNESFVVFVEVKTRIEGSPVKAIEAVDASKRKKLMLTAAFYVSKNETSKQPRFDIFEVIHNGTRLVKFRNNENAFDFEPELTGGYLW